MDVAKHETETAQQQVDDEFNTLDTLLAANPVDADAVYQQLEIVDSELENYYSYVVPYKELLIKGKNNAEYDVQAANHQAYRKKRIVMKNKCVKACKVPTATTSAAGSGGATTAVDPNAYRLSLPQRELPVFDGDVRKFKAFWASFQVIDTNKSIPNIEKFAYLLQCMKIGSKARQVVEDIPPDNNSYDLAKKELQHRYGRDKTIIKEYVRDLMETVVINARKGKDYNFVNMVSSLQSQIANLGQLGVTPDKFGLLLYPIVECCIPPEVLARYLETPGVKEELQELMDFLREEVRRKEDVERAQAAFGLPKEEKKSKKQQSDVQPVPTTTDFLNTATKCSFCSNNHATADCRKAMSMSLEDRKAALKNAGSCFKCLGNKHDSKKCKSKVTCFLCRKNHHTLMCFGEREQSCQQQPRGQGQTHPRDQPQLPPQQFHQQREYQQPPPQQQQFRPPHRQHQDVRAGQFNGNYQPVGFSPPPQQTHAEPQVARTDMANYIRKPEVLLETLLVKAYRADNSFLLLRLLFDTGSQSSYIRTGLLSELGLLPIGMERVCHQAFGGDISPERKHDIVEIDISGVSWNYSERYKLLVSVQDTLARDIIAVPSGPWIYECAQLGIELSDPVNEPSDIDILIGNDIRPYMKVGMQSLQLHSGLIATETRLGWFLEGKIPGTEHRGSSKSMVCTNLLIAEKEIENYWALEAIGIRDAAENKTRAELEEAAVNYFKLTVKRDSTGRYEVHLPWIEGHPNLPDNRAMVFKRLEKTTNELLRDGYLQQYDKIFREWEADGVIERVPDENISNGVVHYLGHRAVIKQGSTTPVRPVFNASGKTKLTPSLNDCLEKGPNFVELIPSILSRMRVNKYAAVADIRKAFLQIVVTPAHRDCLRFPWWEDITTRKQKIVYRHCRVVFGVSSSPFLLGATINHLLEQYQETFPETVKILKQSYYVDNVVTSLPTREAVVQFQKEAVTIMSSAQMDLRGWEFGPSSVDKEVPVLGLIWQTGSDTLSFDLGKTLKREAAVTTFTKRTVLALANSVFDPLGILSPVIIAIRILFKKVCADGAKYSWDVELPENYIKQAKQWSQQLKHLIQLKIPRFIGGLTADQSKWSFHVFSDASLEAYSCIVLLRVEGNPVTVHLVQARARVTPMKVLTIPRGELLGCLIAARLYTRVKGDLAAGEVPVEQLHDRTKSCSVTFWTDSSTALIWITDTSSVWATFVNRRVNEIRELTRLEDWRHIPGELNPADAPSRGITAEKFVQSRWWEGPRFLYLPPESYPVSTPSANATIVSAEKKKTVVSALNKLQTPSHLDCLLRAGDWHKMLRIIVILKRFAAKRKWVLDRNPITVQEMEAAENVLYHYIQQSPELEKWKGSYIYNIDQHGVVRVVTRVSDKWEEDNFTNSVVLPGAHPMVRLLIEKEHSLASHAGVGYMLSVLRQHYWILNPRRAVKTVVHKCPVCRVHFARRCRVQEAPLPDHRVSTTFCFQSTGVDLAGPLTLKTGEKVWVVLYTCAVYRAVHLEMVFSLSTEAFIMALRKFVARRGRPSTIHSDNGTNFHGCQNLFQSLDWKKVLEYANVNRIEWIFNAPLAAWWGGFWERLIGMLKEIVRRILGRKSVNRDELELVLLEAEAVMNERPLTYVSSDPNDLSPLTPSMFIRDLPVAHLPELDVAGESLRSNYRHVQKMKEELRSRFQKEYLAMLVQKRKVRFSDELSPGDVVLVEVENRKRVEWPIAVVVEVYPGRDGVCRTAKVRTRCGEIVRPYQRLFPLEIRRASGEISGKASALEKPEVVKVEEEEDIVVPEEMLHHEEVEPVCVTKSGRVVRKPDWFRN